MVAATIIAKTPLATCIWFAAERLNSSSPTAVDADSCVGSKVAEDSPAVANSLRAADADAAATFGLVTGMHPSVVPHTSILHWKFSTSAKVDTEYLKMTNPLASASAADPATL